MDVHVSCKFRVKRNDSCTNFPSIFTARQHCRRYRNHYFFYLYYQKHITQFGYAIHTHDSHHHALTLTIKDKDRLNTKIQKEESITSRFCSRCIKISFKIPLTFVTMPIAKNPGWEHCLTQQYVVWLTPYV